MVTESKGRISAVHYIYWALVMPVIVFFLIYYLVGISNDYTRAPYGSRITAKPLKYFPAIEICPRLWYDLRISRDIVGNKEALLAYILTLGDGIIANRATEGALEDFNGDIQQIKNSYEALRKIHKNHTGIIKAMAINPSKLFNLLCVGCAEESGPSVKTVFKADGVCFRVTEWKVFHKILKPSENVRLGVFVNKTYLQETLGAPDLENGDVADENGMVVLDDGTDSFAIAAGKAVLGSGIDDSITLHISNNYAIHLGITMKSKLENCEKNSDLEDITEAVQDCAIDRFIANCKNATCTMYIGPASDILGNISFCHQYIANEYSKGGECFDDELDTCNDDIVYPCNETMINVVPQWTEKNQGDTSDIFVYPQNSKSILHVEEFRSFTWNGLVSNVGGLLGVSLGASLYSIAEGIYRLFCYTKRIWLRKSSVESSRTELRV